MRLREGGRYGPDLNFSKFFQKNYKRRTIDRPALTRVPGFQIVPQLPENGRMGGLGSAHIFPSGDSRLDRCGGRRFWPDHYRMLKQADRQALRERALAKPAGKL